MTSRSLLLGVCLLLLAVSVNGQGGLPNLTVNDVALSEGNAGTTTFTFTVSLSAPAGPGGVTFDIATADVTAQDDSPVTEDNDYVPQSLTGQTIPAGSSTYAFNVLVNGDTTPESSETFFVNVTNVSNAVVTDGQGVGTIDNDDLSRIHDVQGNGAATPIPGATAMVEGIVVGNYQGASQLSGFFLQEEDADVDADPATSEGIFVFCSSCPTAVAEGQRVRVAGTVSEFFGTTEITASTAGSVVVTDAGNHLAEVTPTVIDLPVIGDLDAFYESRESMRVTFVDTLTVSEYFELPQYGQLELYEGGRPRQFTETSAPSPAGLTAHLDNLRRRRVILDDTTNTTDAALAQPDGSQAVYHPRVNGGFSVGTQGTDFFRGGDLVNGLTGVLHWSFAGGSSPDAWRIRPTQATPATFTVANLRPATPPVVGGAIKAVSMNLLNYFTTLDTTSSNNTGPCGPDGTLDCRGADSVAELNRQRERAAIVVCSLDADVYAFMELENTASATIADLLGAINARCGGANPYAAVDTGGTLGTDAIRVQQIYRSGVLSPVGSPLVDLDPVHNRPPTAQTFDVIDASNAAFGRRFTVIANHFKSKGCPGTGADADAGDGQGCFNGTRVAQASRLLSWISGTVLPAAGDPDVLLLGDFNSYAKEDPVTTLTGGGFTDLESSFLGANAYSYVFDGQLGHLDYAFSSGSLTPQVIGAAAWHINADEVPLFDYNDEVKDIGESAFEEKPDGSALVPPRVVFQPASPYRASDHDPIVVGLFGSADLSATLTPPSGSLLALTSAPFTITLTNNGPDTAFNISVSRSLTGGQGSMTPGTVSAGVLGSSDVWQIASLTPGANATLTFDLSSVSGPLTLAAQLTSDTGDPVATNNAPAANITVLPRTTNTTVQAAPATVALGDDAVVSVVVTGVPPSGTTVYPLGAVTLTSSEAGDMFTSCTLQPPLSTPDTASCQVTLTPATAGPRTITATFAGSGSFAGSAGGTALTVTPAAPSIASVAPAMGSIEGGTAITITGSHFSAGAAVTIGGAAATGVAVVDATTITAITPAHAAGLVDVTVTISGAPPATLAGAFEYSSGWRLTVTRSGAGGGRIVSTADGIACGDTCAAMFPAASDVELVAIPAADSMFAGWSGDAECSDGRVTLDHDTACSARFTRLTSTAMLDANGDGLSDVIGYAPPPAAAGSALGGRASLLTSTGVLRAGDFDGDHRTDVFDYDPISGAWRIALAAGGEASGMLPPRRSPLTAELNGDGRTDLALVDPVTGEIQLCAAAALPACAVTVFAPAGADIHALDADGNGRADLMAYVPATGQVQFLLSGGGSGFGPLGADVTVLDADGNRHSDLLFYDPAAGTASLAMNRASGFPLTTYAVGAGWTMRTARLNADRFDDLIAYHPATGAVMLAVSHGNGTFVVSAAAVAPNHELSVGDFNGDGLTDGFLYDAATGAVLAGISLGPTNYIVMPLALPSGLSILTQAGFVP